MASLRMNVLARLLRLLRKRRFSTVEGAQRVLQAPKGDATPPARLSRRHRVRCRMVGPLPVWSVTPGVGRELGVVIYLHGGAYVSEIVTQHWAFVGQLADEVGCRVEVPIYGLAPASRVEAAIEQLVALYREVVEDVGSGRVVLAGDSAGGGLVLALAQALPERRLPQPAELLLLSPWLDVALANPEVAAVERRDPWLASVGLRLLGGAWAGDLDAGDPRVSPINGCLAGLAPMEVYIGTQDLLLPDCRKLRDLVTAAGGDIRLHEVEGAFHVFVLAPVPEARRDRRRIVADLRRRLTAD